MRCCVWPREAAGGANVRAGVTASGYLVEKSCRKSAGDIVSVLAGAGLWTEMCRVRVVNVVLGLCISDAVALVKMARRE